MNEQESPSAREEIEMSEKELADEYHFRVEERLGILLDGRRAPHLAELMMAEAEAQAAVDALAKEQGELL
jgi:hypothetical protein